ncbi:His/Gly/Thr/Pro-type tRNA ligase C-terminal domain-containing protein [Erysipelothrix sp. Poltava]|nr:His/Gly/Thr/Pro-type tRNA ligase C-terminal domain-containing protein [Erysipelothrix sp. Poltava]
MGLERLLLYADLAGVEFDTEDRIDVFGMPLGHEANGSMFKMIETLREAGYDADMDYYNKSMKAQFKQVDRFNAKIAMICGSDEVAENVVTLKNIETQEQCRVAHDDVVEQVRKWIESK